MQIFQFRQTLITGLFILTGYFYSNGQTIINLEPELPDPIAALAQQPGLKSWYNKTAKTWCCIYNDRNAVYIQLSITDLLQQKKVVENGIELWIDVKGKKKRNTGIIFPLPEHTASNYTTHQNESGFPFPTTESARPLAKTATRQQLRSLVSGQTEMKLKGFMNELNGTQNAKHPSGLQVSLQYDHDTLIYQATIPFQALDRPVSFNSAMNIGIVAKGMLPAGFVGIDMPDLGEQPGDGMMPPPGEAFSAAENTKQFRKDDITWYRFTVRR
ncbi:MAG TPA: hypothetical protein VF008_31655 [Niastella sp.]